MHTQIVTIHFSPTCLTLQELCMTMGSVCIKCYTHNVILMKPHISQFLPTIKQTPNIAPFSSYSVYLHDSNISAKILTMSKKWSCNQTHQKSSTTGRSPTMNIEFCSGGIKSRLVSKALSQENGKLYHLKPKFWSSHDPLVPWRVGGWGKT